MQDSKPCWLKFLGNSRFWKILNGFPRIPVKIHKILGKFMEFPSGSPSIYYRISSVVRGGCVDIFWNSPMNSSYVASLLVKLAELHRPEELQSTTNRWWIDRSTIKGKSMQYEQLECAIKGKSMLYGVII